MNRRAFLRSLVGGIAAGAAAASAVRTYPFRVFSFPREIVVPEYHLVFDCTPLLPSLELLQDSAFDLEAYLSKEFSRRMMRNMFIGNGGPEPRGLLSFAT
jgi:hypothetical protein